MEEAEAVERRTVAVVGATGFVGSHVVARLADAGHQVVGIGRTGRRVASWPASVESRAADVESGRGLEAALQGADAVVHLVAIPRESGGRTFDEVNVGGTRRVVQAASAAGIRRFVHLSVLGAAEDPKLGYLHSKWLGERIVRESELEWVVFRPSLLFGHGDGFFSLVRTTLKRWSPGIVAIPGRGDTRFQPLAVDDLARAVERAVVDAERARSVYEVGGPEYWSYRQIVDEVMRVTGMRRLKLGMPVPLLGALTAVTDRILPAFPVSHDQIASLGRPNFTELDAFERAFGFPPRPVDLRYLGKS